MQDNRNLVSGFIVLTILVIVAALYWDRQQERILDQAKAHAQTDLLDEWGPGAQQQVQTALQARPAAFSQISYRQIIQRVAPSVVSINVVSKVGLFNQATGTLEGQAVALPGCVLPGQGQGNQGAGVLQGQAVGLPGCVLPGQGSQVQNVAFANTDWRANVVGVLACPYCKTRVPHRRGVPAHTVNCPNCQTLMMTDGNAGICRIPVPGVGVAAASPEAAGTEPVTPTPVAATPAPAPGTPGPYWVCPNCSTSVPCVKQTGVPGVNCPSCGVIMSQAAQPWTCPVPGPDALSPVQNPLPGVFEAPAEGPESFFPAAGKGGSGVIVDPAGYVLTNHHVISGAQSITVIVDNGATDKTYAAQLIDEDPDLDFAILKIMGKGERFPAAPLGSSSVVSVGDEVLAIGSPYGLSQTTTFGIVSNGRRSITLGNQVFADLIQTDAPTNPGSSGGALVNIQGEVIGINTAIYSQTRSFSGIGFALPIDAARNAFPEFVPASRQRLVMPMFKSPMANAKGPFAGSMRPAAGNPASPGCWLGIRTCAMSEQVQADLGLPLRRGVVVTDVFAGSPALNAGLKPGDVIIRLDDRSIKDEAMLGTFLAEKRVTDSVKLSVYQGGKKKTVNCQLGNLPAQMQARNVGQAW